MVDLAALVRALRAVGSDGWLSFEDFTTDRLLAGRIADNLAYVKQMVTSVSSWFATQPVHQPQCVPAGCSGAAAMGTWHMP